MGSGAKPATKEQIEESRRLLYVGMTRAKDRLAFTHARSRGDREGGGHQFLDEMGVVPEQARG
jgi:superfamily I DNA/RNA helicase